MKWLSNQSNGVIAVVALFVLVVVFTFPFVCIWSLNTLFNLGIAYGVAEYFAVVVLNIWTLRYKTKSE